MAQPFVAVGVRLRQAGHRARLATHAEFRRPAMDAGLEFYPLEGDSRGLARFAAESGGAFPPRSMKAVDELRRQVGLYLRGQLKACIEPDPDDPAALPFRAEALIANPISYGHIHIADALGLPMHFLFTMPWTSTREFAHPQARFLHEKMFQLQPKRGSLVGYLLGCINKASYAGVHSAMAMGVALPELLLCLHHLKPSLRVDYWGHEGDLISAFRRQQLQATPLWKLQHYHRLFDPPLDRRRGRPQSRAIPIPASYCYSASLVPRPLDWPPHIQVAGYCKTPDDTAGFQPPASLRDFLAAGPPPVYFGFGSMPLSKPQKVLEIICATVTECDQRAVVLTDEWEEAAAEVMKQHAGQVLMIRAVPHSWLFPHCCAVVHHGGAGTTAAGLQAGRPTTIVPTFGDQPFWGAMCKRAGVGPTPIAVDRLTQKRLVKALRHMAQPNVIAAAKDMAARLAVEADGATAVVQHFQEQLALWREAQPAIETQHAQQAGTQSAHRAPHAHQQPQHAQQAGTPSAHLAPHAHQQPQHETAQHMGSQHAQHQQQPQQAQQDSAEHAQREHVSSLASRSWEGNCSAAPANFTAEVPAPRDALSQPSGSLPDAVTPAVRSLSDPTAASSAAAVPPDAATPSVAIGTPLPGSSRRYTGTSSNSHSASSLNSSDCGSPASPASVRLQVWVGSSLMDDMERGWSSARRIHPESILQQEVPASARYFRPKRAPLLSAWMEAVVALGQTLLLPLISMAPANGVLRS